MSAANNTSKSGSKSCGSPDEYYEDEIVTWLQYPLGDSLEKGYCSELFGQWPSGGSTVVKPPTTIGASKMPVVTSMGVGTCTYSENGSFSRSECATTMVDSGSGNLKERVASASIGVARTTCAEGALALGAERAAGLVSQSGRDEFSKVKTSMQPPAGSQLTPLSSLHAVAVPEHSFRCRPVAVPGCFTSKLPQSPQCGLASPSKPPASVSSGLASTGKGTMPSSVSFTTYRPRNSAEAPLQMPSAQESGCSRVTDEVSVRRAPEYASSMSSRGQAGIGQAVGVMPARFTPPNMEVHCERTAALGMSELVASSGRSLSGTTLSTREASSNSGKRKLEDSESQSEDVEGESSIDIKQPRKPSSSKRNRAAEVHNLSERNRRNRINEKLKALQDLIPNSSKTDKASVLDEAIEYMKTLQMQLQMVSMRSGLSVSPMMIPLGMPHLQMAPLHPVGLGVPVGHPGLGMGMGLHMSMGMGMMDLAQGMTTRPPQPVSASPNHFSIPYQVRSTTGLHDCSLDSSNMGSIPSQFMPLPHSSSQIHPGLSSFSSVHPRQQQEQWQHTGQHSEAREPFNEQVGKEG
ncbi:hypothetical protein GOP47_0026032 [Adiantum capillus-veneris]|nr:hypothetical protein GOP47_0026032 [Adiantum capillus-veneris]